MLRYIMMVAPHLGAGQTSQLILTHVLARHRCQLDGRPVLPEPPFPIDSLA